MLHPAKLAQFVRAEVQARLAEGRDIGAVELWLDGATMASDCRDWFTLRHFLLSTWQVPTLDALAVAALDVLTNGLARLDDEVALGTEFERQLATAIRQALAGRDFSVPGGRIDTGLVARAAAWHAGFDPATLHLEQLADLRRDTGLLTPAAPDEVARRAQWDAFRAARRPVDSGIANACSDWIRSQEALRVDCLDGLRHLRRSLAFVRGLPVSATPR
ncbi:MAG: hypothetical protein KDE27_30480 [Planctomycetes bacterium]|nr:hypothetical protein [Planctomycetota bacterium]